MNSDFYHHRNSLLNKCLTIYITKRHITIMRPIIESIHDRIKSNNQISPKQFGVLVSYLKNDFKNFTDKQLWDFFSPLIYNYPTTDDDKYMCIYHPTEYQQMLEKNSPPTLEKFMN